MSLYKIGSFILESSNIIAFALANQEWRQIAIGQDRLSNLSLMAIEQELLDSVDGDAITKTFSKAKVQKVNIWKKLL